ncbi:hypothetical protein [Rhodobaculum claviforme]|nr:hypothetical protein [Rhodobaculum claviforme]
MGEITMAGGLLYAKIDKLEGGRPLARRSFETGRAATIRSSGSNEG